MKDERTVLKDENPDRGMADSERENDGHDDPMAPMMYMRNISDSLKRISETLEKLEKKASSKLKNLIKG